MNIFTRIKTLPKIAFVCFALFLVALIVRLYNITDNQFLFYDEGMYLGQNRGFVNLVAANPPHSIAEFFVILGLMFKSALSTAKALWFFLLNLRVFVVGPEGWYFARIISAAAGIGSIALTYFWARRHWGNRVAVLSAVMLSLLPSHVFYSRLGMQESLSTFLFLLAIYLYTAKTTLNWRMIVSAVVLSCVFFTNYRMIVAPFFIVFMELFESWHTKRKIQWQVLAIYLAIFYGIVFFIGSLYDGANRYVTFGWMAHQAQDAKEKVDLINFLSYPYYVFALEGGLFGLLFWSNIKLALSCQWKASLPFALVLIQMGMFSFAAEKGARYLCVVLPFMAVAGAIALDFWLQLSKGIVRKVVCACIAVMFISMAVESTRLALSTTDYKKAVDMIFAHDPDAVIISTQPLVEELYVQRPNQIFDCPKDLGGLLEQYKKGARYLILDPQAYVSWTQNQERFSPPLLDFLEYARRQQTPLFTLNHIQGPLLKRFVLDHNERLVNSLNFLANEGERYGQIYVYDLGALLAAIHARSNK